MTKLPGNLYKKLQEALISAFPHYSSLMQMVRFQLDESLEKIAGTGALDAVVFKLIEWAEANGYLDNLIQGAKKANPQNQKLNDFFEIYISEDKSHASKTIQNTKVNNAPNSVVSKKKKLNVFLCYASEDKQEVRKLYQKLNNESWIDPWLDEMKILPGQDWDREIEVAIENTDVVIVFISKNSVSKEGYIQREIKKVLGLAKEKLEGSIFVIPLRLDKSALPRSFQKLQYVDYFPIDVNRLTYDKLLQSMMLCYSKIT